MRMYLMYMTTFERIQSEFAAGRTVMICTHLKSWIFRPKHAEMFRPAKASDATDGVYMQRGRAWDYVLPGYVRFEKSA